MNLCGLPVVNLHFIFLDQHISHKGSSNALLAAWKSHSRQFTSTEYQSCARDNFLSLQQRQHDNASTRQCNGASETRKNTKNFKASMSTCLHVYMSTSELVAQFCNPATGGLELRDGWRRPGPTDLEEGQFQDRIMPSQQALRRAIRETMDILVGTNFPVMCMGEQEET